MPSTSDPLIAFASNVTSQDGEDGILAEPKLEVVFNPAHLTYLVASFDGRYFLTAAPPFGSTRLSFSKRIERLFRSLRRRPTLTGLERVECYAVKQWAIHHGCPRTDP